MANENLDRLSQFAVFATIVGSIGLAASFFIPYSLQPATALCNMTSPSVPREIVLSAKLPADWIYLVVFCAPFVASGFMLLTTSRTRRAMLSLVVYAAVPVSMIFAGLSGSCWKGPSSTPLLGQHLLDLSAWILLLMPFAHGLLARRTANVA